MRCAMVMVMVVTVGIGGCATQPPAGYRAEDFYYRHLYPTARDVLRGELAGKADKNVILNSMRLGMASLADGDEDEAERALLRAYSYLIGGKINEDDRKLGATLIVEDIKVWTGDPYEKAMSFYYLAVLSMMRGEWDNARAAIRNALFRLRAFDVPAGEGQTGMAEVAGAAAQADADPQEISREVQSQFALGYLIAGLCEVQLGTPDEAKPHFDRVRELNSDLAPLVDALAGDQFDTLLLIDYGRGPRKVSYGPDNALVMHVPDGRRRTPPSLAVTVDGQVVEPATARPAVDLWTLSQFPQWWSLESIRKAKSAIGNFLLVGGSIAAVVGTAAGSEEAQWAGLGAAAAGLVSKASAQADVRHLGTLPRCVYIVPLQLGEGRHDVRIGFDRDRMSGATWHDLTGGAKGRPSVYYLRMHGEAPGMPRWSDAPTNYSLYTQRPAGLRPYLLGGHDMAWPTEQAAEAYEAAVLSRWTAFDLASLCRAEGLFQRPGPQGMTDAASRAPGLYRHVAEGGRVLWSPKPGTHAHERLTRQSHPPYKPVGEALRRATRQLVGSEGSAPVQ
jgi:tetratricopeptide (TPR) repeat protein